MPLQHVVATAKRVAELAITAEARVSGRFVYADGYAERTTYRATEEVLHVLDRLLPHLPPSRELLVSIVYSTEIAEQVITGITIPDSCVSFLVATGIVDRQNLHTDMLGMFTGSPISSDEIFVPTESMLRLLCPVLRIPAGLYEMNTVAIGGITVVTEINRLPQFQSLPVTRIVELTSSYVACVDGRCYQINQEQSTLLQMCLNAGVLDFSFIPESAKLTPELVHWYPVLPQDIEGIYTGSVSSTISTELGKAFLNSTDDPRAISYVLRLQPHNLYIVVGGQRVTRGTPLETRGTVARVTDYDNGRRQLVIATGAVNTAPWLSVRLMDNTVRVRTGDVVSLAYRASRTCEDLRITSAFSVIKPLLTEGNVNTTAMLLLEDLVEDLEKPMVREQVRERLYQILLAGAEEERQECPPVSAVVERAIDSMLLVPMEEITLNGAALTPALGSTSTIAYTTANSNIT